MRRIEREKKERKGEGREERGGGERESPDKVFED